MSLSYSCRDPFSSTRVETRENRRPLFTFFDFFPHRDERRVEIEICPPVPGNITGLTPLIQEWANHLILGIGMDVKHTNNWECAICGELILVFPSWACRGRDCS
jgi:hypothetical protein